MANQLRQFDRTRGVEIVEMDEMHTYIGVKKTIAGSGLLLIDMERAFSRALWAPATRKPGAHYGTPSKPPTEKV